MSYYKDNQTFILIANNQDSTKRRKYIDIRHHYLQQHVSAGQIKLYCFQSTEIDPDIVT